MHGLRIKVEDHTLFAAFGTGHTPATHRSIPSLCGARRSFATRGRRANSNDRKITLSSFLFHANEPVEFFDEIQKKVLRVFLLASQSPLQLCLEISISSKSHNLL
jgi:hypothetical protein